MWIRKILQRVTVGEYNAPILLPCGGSHQRLSFVHRYLLAGALSGKPNLPKRDTFALGMTVLELARCVHAAYKR